MVKTRRRSRPSQHGLLASGLILLLAGCSASAPETLGPAGNALAPCPDAPNCVHTGAEHPPGIAPFELTPGWADRPAEEVWSAVESAVASLPGTEVVTRSENYLHAESTSRIFRFVDDLEVYRGPGSAELVVRSASRLGRSDLGVNMRRVEQLREALQARGVVD